MRARTRILDKVNKENAMGGLIAMVSDCKITRFERARIIGARALQISCGAPLFIEYPKCMVDPIDIAEFEFKQGKLPITVVREA